jgi:hypothetical protein
MLYPWKKQSNDALVKISAAGPEKVLPHWVILLQPKPDALSEKSAGISGFIERGLFCLAFLPLLISLKFTPFLELLIFSRTPAGFLPLLILLELLEIR